MDILNVILQLCLIFIVMAISKTAFAVVLMMLFINILSSVIKIIYTRCVMKVKVKYHYYDKIKYFFKQNVIYILHFAKQYDILYPEQEKTWVFLSQLFKFKEETVCLRK